jgi:uncharacterized protein YidB (DUF937 family)
MGFMDILNGMKNGPHGQAGSSGSSTGMSPITMGLLALLAYKTLKGSGPLGNLMGHANSQSGRASYPGTEPPMSPTPSGGGLSDWLGGLGSLVAGGGAGSILTAGLGELVKRFQQNGQGDVAHSWVGTGPNKSVAPHDLEKAVGGDTLDTLAHQTGMTREQVLAELSERLPKTVDTLTPAGRFPTEQEASHWA